MRTIFGELRDSQDQPIRHRTVRFVRDRIMLKNGRLYLPDSQSVSTDEDGKFSINLVETTDSDLPSSWHCTIPGEGSFEFELEPGEPIDIATLRLANE